LILREHGSGPEPALNWRVAMGKRLAIRTFVFVAYGMIPSVPALRLFGALVALWVLPAGLHAAAATELGEAAGSISVPGTRSEAEIQDVVVRALVGRQWEVVSKGPDRVVGYLKHRGNEATLTIVYSTAKIDLFCVGWKIDKAGVRQKPEQPKGWLNYIKADISKILSRTGAAAP
jgi:hypothetical protein